MCSFQSAAVSRRPSHFPLFLKHNTVGRVVEMGSWPMQRVVLSFWTAAMHGYSIQVCQNL